MIANPDCEFLATAGITHGPIGKMLPGQTSIELYCGHCSKPIERRLTEIRNLVTKRGSRSFFCNRDCKNAAESSLVQAPPVLSIPDYLRQPIVAASEIELGKAAEHLVCADLILLGHRAYLSDQGLPYDVVVDVSGHLIRIQVKGTAKYRAVPQRRKQTPSYYWNPKRAGRAGRRRYGANEFDMVALVAVDIRCIAYLSLSSGLTKQTIALRPPQTPITHKNKRLKNIDQYPFASALAEVLK